MGKGGRTARILRRLAWTGAAVVALVLLLGSVAPTLVEWAVPRWASSRGLTGLSFEVRALGPGHLEIAELQLAGAREAVVGRLVADYRPGQLLSGQVDRVQLTDVRLSGSVDPAGLTLGGLDAFLNSSSSPGGVDLARAGARPFAFPIRRLQLDSARIDLESPIGPISVSVEGTLDDAALRASGKLRASDRGFEARFDLSPVSGVNGATLLGLIRLPLALQVDAVVQQLSAASLSAEQAQLRLRGTIGEADGVFELGLSDCARLVLSGVTLGVSDVLPETLELCIEALPGPAAGSAAVTVLRVSEQSIAAKLRLVASGGTARVELEGLHRLDLARGEGSFRLAPVVFAEDGLQPSDLYPPLGEWVEAATGSIDAEASLRWTDGEVSGSSELHLDRLSLAARGASIEQVDGRIRSALPLPGFASMAGADPPWQKLRFARLTLGELELADGLLSFVPLRDGGMLVEEFSFAALGGRMRGEGEVRDFGAQQRWTLAVENLSVGELLALIEIEGLDGEGRLAGSIPVAVADGQAVIRHGSLRSQGSGRIRYRPSTRAPAPSEALGGLDLTMKILENFIYDDARVTVDGDAGGDLSIYLQLRGANPAVGGGRPVEFNLNLDVPLARILRGVAVVSDLSDRIEHSLRGLRGSASE